jgi:predicted enzyme related to lactoylglutathione lyase
MRLLVNVDVDDLVRATDFYQAAFGLRVGRRFGKVAVELLGLEAPLYLLLKATGTPPHPGASAPRGYGRHWTPVHLDFAVENLEVGLARAQAAGARREGEIEIHPWGRIAYLADPFGHGFCLLELSERGYDAVATPSEQ